MDLSIIIPAYKDPYLNKTIESIHETFETDYEIIPVLDGVDPTEPLPDYPEVHPIRLPDNVGMRRAINAGVRAAQGTYLMRSDAHCMFATGFDAVILDTIQDNWIVDAKRYFLDPVTWTVMEEVVMTSQLTTPHPPQGTSRSTGSRGGTPAAP